MYYTEMEPWTREPVFVEKDPVRKQKQKDVVTQKEPVKQKHHGKPAFKKHEQRKGKKAVPKEQNRTAKPSNYKEYKTLHKVRKSYAEE
jgi:hypothetical protein